MLEDREIAVLIEELYKYHGYDFSGYSAASFRRRVERLYQMDSFENFAQFLSKARSDEEYFKHIVEEITVNVTEMFRDPSFYKILRTEILPILATKPFIRIWHAGCATGEEVFSVAILLKELNLLNKSLLYATDLNPTVLDVARKGLFPLRTIQQYAENYRIASGKNDFSDYYTANYGFAKFNDELISRMVFSQHNLVIDGSFNEFDLILCRNVLIYFDKDFQRIALELFDQSLSKLGYLALGSKETIKFSSIQHRYKQFEKGKNMEEDALNKECKLLLIGGSAGSLEVLMTILPKLNPILNFAIAIILHRKGGEDSTLEDLIRVRTKIPLTLVEDKVILKCGNLYVAPSDYHMLFEKNRQLSLDVSEKVNYSRPSIDVSFESAAAAFGKKCIAILLSGANADGTNGLKAIQKEGGVVILQNPENAIMPFMPQTALSSINPTHVFEVSEILDYINSIDNA